MRTIWYALRWIVFGPVAVGMMLLVWACAPLFTPVLLLAAPPSEWRGVLRDFFWEFPTDMLRGLWKGE